MPFPQRFHQRFFPGFFEQDGLSPIQIAATKGNLACVRVLIDKGAKLLGVYPNSDRTVIDALFDSLDDSDLVTFFMKLFDSRIHFLEHQVSEILEYHDKKNISFFNFSQTESAALDYRVLAPLGEESMAVVQALMKKIMTVELRAIMQHPLLLAYIRTEFHRYRRAFWWFLGLWAIYVYPLYLYSDELVYGKINLFWVAVVTPFAACIRILGSTKFPLKLKQVLHHSSAPSKISISRKFTQPNIVLQAEILQEIRKLSSRRFLDFNNLNYTGCGIQTIF